PLRPWSRGTHQVRFSFVRADRLLQPWRVPFAFDLLGNRPPRACDATMACAEVAISQSWVGIRERSRRFLPGARNVRDNRVRFLPPPSATPRDRATQLTV